MLEGDVTLSKQSITPVGGNACDVFFLRSSYKNLGHLQGFCLNPNQFDKIFVSDLLFFLLIVFIFSKFLRTTVFYYKGKSQKKLFLYIKKYLKTCISIELIVHFKYRKFQDVAQLVARLFWEQGVAGSNPVILILNLILIKIFFAKLLISCF